MDSDSLPVRGATPPEDAPAVEASLRALYLTPLPTISLSAYLAMKTRAETAEAQLAEAQLTEANVLLRSFYHKQSLIL